MALTTTSAWINPLNESLSVAQGASSTFSAADLAGDDTGLNGSVIQLQNVNQPTHGVVTDLGGGQYTYTPADGYTGADSFTYTVTDQHGYLCTEMVQVTVTTGDAPLITTTTTTTSHSNAPPPVIVCAVDDVGASTGTIHNGGSTDDTTPTLQGSAEPGTRIAVYDNGAKIGEAIAAADWQWTFTPTAALPAGNHSFSAVATNPDGSSGAHSPFNFDCVITGGGGGGGGGTPVGTPIITSLNDDVGSSQGPIANGAVTDDALPTLKGTGEPGSLITVYDNGVKLGTATVGPDWLWTFTPAAPLAAGPNNFTIVGSHPDGSGTANGAYPYGCNIVLTPPVNPVLAPIITTAVDHVGAAQGPITNGGTTDDPRPVIQGTGEPGSQVTVYDNGVKIGVASVGADWLWSLTPTTAFNNGPHAITAVGSHPDGSGSTPAPYPYSINEASNGSGGGGSPLDPPIIVITTDANNDGVISPSEFNGQINFTVTLPASALAGETLALTDNYGHTKEILLTPADVAARVLSFPNTFPPPANGQTLTVNASISNAAGDCSPIVSDSAVMQTGNNTLGAPTVVITTDANNDGIISAAEFNGQINFTVALPPDAKAGDTLTVTDNYGHQQPRVLTPADIAAQVLSFPNVFPAPANGQPLTISASLSNPAGAHSPTSSDTATMDTGGPAPGAPTIVIVNDVNNDGIISQPEYAPRVDVQVTLPVAAKTGDQLTVTDNAGNVAGRVLTPADIATGKVTLPSAFPTPLDGQTITVSAKVITPAGQSSPSGTDSATVDLTAPTAPGVIITTDDNNDGQISSAELAAHHGIDVKTPLPADARAGDTLTVTDNAGHTLTKVLTPTDVSVRSVTFTNAFPTPADGQTITVHAKLTDPAGNVSPEATDSADIHTSAPAITVTIVNDKDNNGTITRAELAGATRIDAKVDLPPAAHEGDRVDVADQTGMTVSKVLTAADLAAHSVYFPSAFGLPASGGAVVLTAKITDTAGNVSPVATDRAIFDGNYPPAAVDDINSVKGSAPGHPANPATGNVLSNDTDPDGPVSALRVAGVSDLSSAVRAGTGVDTPIEGRYGHLTVHPDGTYTYVSDKSAGLTNATDDVFYYINKDADGGLSPTPAKLTIHIDPPFSQISGVSSPTATEGAPLDFTVTTSGSQVPTPITLALQSGTATVGQDTGAPLQVNYGQGWIPVPGNTFELPAGVTSFQVRVPTIDDTLVEPTETLTLNVSSPMSTNVVGTGTILDNDTLGSHVTGKEDTPLPLHWNDFGINSLPNGTATSLTITQLPADGVLQYNNGGNWTPVTIGQQLTKADIDAGKLRFVPDPNEAGIDGYHNPGVGNMHNDYAQASYTVTDGAGNTFNGKLTIDIAPVADCAAVITSNTMSSNGGGFPAGYNEDQALCSTADGHQTTPSDPNGYTGYWEHVTLKSTNASPDKDGSEKLVYQLHINQYDNPNALTLVMLQDGTVLHPDASGDYWAPATGDSTTVYEYRQWGKGPNGTHTSHQTVTATVWTEEVGADGTVMDKCQGDTKTSGTNTPLVLDLNGDGVHTVDAQHGVQFDFTGTGAASGLKSGWVDSHDGLLVLDRNGDGKIDTGTELFGDATKLVDGSTATNGFQALADLDSNHDGKITNADAFFAQLQVWVDANGDGVTQPGELHSLTDLGIASLNLDATASTATDQGNTLGLVSDYTTADGANHAMADVWFAGTDGGNDSSQAVATQGLDAEGPALDTLLANAGLTQEAATPVASKPTDTDTNAATGNSCRHHVGHSDQSSGHMLVQHHEWAH